MTERRQVFASMAAALAIVAVLYAPLFGGYFLGDDFANIAKAHDWFNSGTLGEKLLAGFMLGVDSAGSFYRPLLVAHLSLNYLLAGTVFSGWFLHNLTLHLVCVGLVAHCVSTLHPSRQRDAIWTTALAATWFGLAAWHAEAVYWPSARSDIWVTALSLFGLAGWLRPRSSRMSLIGLPLATLAALGFKESAVVLPLQVILLLVFVPALRTRTKWVSVGTSLALAAAYLLVRALLFGDPTQVYDDTSATIGLTSWQRLSGFALSFAFWWPAALGTTSNWALLALLLPVPVFVICLVSNRETRGMALACSGAALGMLVATGLNLGSMQPTGEGGRLLYSAGAWFALALGIASPATGRRLVRAQMGALLLASVLLALSLSHTLEQTLDAQSRMRRGIASINDWASRNPDSTALWLVPDHGGPIILARNAQASLVSPPFQTERLIPRILPSLAADSGGHYDSYQAGLLALPGADSALDQADTLRASPRFPDHLLCLDTDGGVLDLGQPESRSQADWERDIEQRRDKAAACPGD